MTDDRPTPPTADLDRTAADGTYDAVVVGGGAAGLNAALVLARSRRRVLVLDAGAPRNGPAAAVHALLGHDGVPPAELLARGREEVRGYGGHVVGGEVGDVRRRGDELDVALADGRAVRARRLVVATGLVDRLPEVPGLAGRWGHDVLHCPYCHGWEVRDRAIGVLSTGPMTVHQALLFRQLSDDVIVFAHTGPALEPDQVEQLVARGIRVVDGEVTAVRVEEDRLTGLHLADGTVVPLEALAVATRMEARAGFLAGLGLEPVEHPSGMGRHLPADPAGRTTAPGVWVAGNATDLTAQVGAAAAAGAMAGAQVNADLVAEETARAVHAARAGRRSA
jgi:thioredoxin reductase